MSAGSQNSSSSSGSESRVDPVQQGFLQNLWGQAVQTNPNQMGAQAFASAGAGREATQTAINRTQNIARDPLGGLDKTLGRLDTLGNFGAQQNQSQPALTTLAGLMDSRGQIAAQSASLKSGLGELFSEEINPALKGNAIAAGGFGGGRQGVAQGQAAGELMDSYTQGLGDITAGANAQAAAAAQGYSGILEGLRSSVLGANQSVAGIRSDARSQAMQASSLIPTLGQAGVEFGTAGQDTRMRALQALAGIYGSPNNLIRSWSGSNSSGWDFGLGS